MARMSVLYPTDIRGISYNFYKEWFTVPAAFGIDCMLE